MDNKKYNDWLFFFVVAAFGLIGSLNMDLFMALTNIVVIFFAMFIYMIATNSRKISGMSAVMLIAICYFWVSVYDLFAMFSNDPLNLIDLSKNQYYQLIMFARVTESAALLVSFMIYRFYRNIKLGVTNVMYGIAVVTVIALIIYTDIFAPMIVNGEMTIMHHIVSIVIAVCFLVLIVFILTNKSIFIYRYSLYTAFTIKIAVSIVMIFDISDEIWLLIVLQLLRVISMYIIFKTISVDAIRDPFKSVLNVFESREEKLIQLTKTDQLTDVLNHTAIIDEIEKKVQVCLTDCDGKNCASIFLLDVNKFKNINDTYGHQKGDEVLISVANVLKECIHSSEHVGRYGGDEFLLLLNQKDTYYINRVYDKLSKKLQDLSEDMKISISVSIGVSCVKEGITTTELIKQADIKMYEAKENNEPRYRIWRDR